MSELITEKEDLQIPSGGWVCQPLRAKKSINRLTAKSAAGRVVFETEKGTILYLYIAFPKKNLKMQKTISDQGT